MKIVIDTEKKTIEAPSSLVKANAEINKMLGKKSESILDSIDTKNYKIIAKPDKKIGDRTNAKYIEEFMKKIKDTNKDLYEEYRELKDKVVDISSNGKPVKTNFLVLRKWFYEKFPNQKPTKKEKSQ